MLGKIKLVTTVTALCLVAPACGTPLRGESEPANAAAQPVANQQETTVTNQQVPLNQRFGSLDEYLTYLEQRGTLDRPWWREVEPGIYELVTTFRPVDGAPPERATRAELMRRFGFTR